MADPADPSPTPSGVPEPLLGWSLLLGGLVCLAAGILVLQRGQGSLVSRSFLVLAGTQTVSVRWPSRASSRERNSRKAAAS